MLCSLGKDMAKLGTAVSFTSKNTVNINVLIGDIRHTHTHSPTRTYMHAGKHADIDGCLSQP